MRYDAFKIGSDSAPPSIFALSSAAIVFQNSSLGVSYSSS